MNNSSLALKSVRHTEMKLSSGFLSPESSYIRKHTWERIRNTWRGKFFMNRSSSTSQSFGFSQFQWFYWKNSQKSDWSVGWKPSSKCQPTLVMANHYLCAFSGSIIWWKLLFSQSDIYTWLDKMCSTVGGCQENGCQTLSSVPFPLT